MEQSVGSHHRHHFAPAGPFSRKVGDACAGEGSKRTVRTRSASRQGLVGGTRGVAPVISLGRIVDELDAVIKREGEKKPEQILFQSDLNNLRAIPEWDASNGVGSRFGGLPEFCAG